MTLKMFESGWNLMQHVNLTSNHPSEIKKMSLNEYIFSVAISKYFVV